MKKLLLILFIFCFSYSFGQTNLITDKGVKTNIDTSTAIIGLTTLYKNSLKVDSVTKNATYDSIYTWKNGTHTTIKDSVGLTALPSTTVTEQQSFYHGEFYWGHGLNTSTGAFTTNTAIDISDYLPVLGSTSITVSTTDSSLITIYGWTYDTTLAAISEIRSNTLIGTTLKTYTFTTPSNARYLALYTKAASDSFNVRLRIYSTNPITYTVPVTPEQFTGGATSRINQAIKFARFTTAYVLMRGEYDLDSTIIPSSGTTLICDGCLLKMKYGMHDNIIRNEAVAQPASHIFNRGNREIKIIGIGNATMQGSSEAWGGDSQTGLGKELWRLHMVNLSNVERFEFAGFKIKSPNQWGIVIEQSRIGSIHDNTAEEGIEHTNQSFLQFHHGSHGINVYDNRGNSTDDYIAFENLQYHDSMNILSTNIYEPFRSNLDIFGIRVWGIQKSRILGYSGTGYGRSRVGFVYGDGFKIHDISVDGNDGYQEILLGYPGSTYIYTTNPTVNDLYNITISNTTAPITINWPVKWSSFINVAATDTTLSIASAKPPSGSSKIYRKYINAQQEWIDTVITSVETISYTSPIFKGSLVANGTTTIEGNSATSGNTATNASINLNVGNSGSTNAATIFNNGNISVGSTSSAFRMFVQSSATSDGVVVNSQTSGWPLFATQIDGSTKAIIGTNRNANDAVTGSLANDLVIRTAGSNIDFTPIPATGIQWQIKSTGELLTPIDNTYDIGATGATRPRSLYVGTNGTFGGFMQAPTVQGGAGSGGNLALSSTSNGTKGKITFGTSAYDEVNNRLGVADASPTRPFVVQGSAFVYKGTPFSYSDPVGTDFVVSNTAQNSRFLFGQSTSSYGGLLWNFNATPASAFLSIFSGDASKINLSLLQNGNVGVATVTAPTSVLQTTSFAPGYVAKATSYTATITDYTIEVTATGQTITLPTAVGISGRVYIVKLTSAGSSTVATTSSQTIDGSTTYSLSAQYKYVTVQSNNANWIIIANN